jgi:hypothetical protein
MRHERKLTVAVELDRRILPEPNSGCWLWTGGMLGNRRYGVMTYNGRRMVAHRAIYMQHKGAIPDGLVLDHLCRVTCCVNPDHLEPVTQAENNRRGISNLILGAKNLAKDRCKRGHLFTNRHFTKDGKRYCPTCRYACTVRWRRASGMPTRDEWRAAKTHCVNGHEFTSENTYRHSRGRQCRACGRERMRGYRAAAA